MTGLRDEAASAVALDRAVLDDDARAELEAWEAEHPGAGTLAWPGWARMMDPGEQAPVVTVAGDYLFAQVPDALIFAGLGAEAIAAYAALARYAGRKAWAFPGLTALADRTGMTERALRRGMRAGAAFIRVKRRGQGRTNLYLLHPLGDAADLSKSSVPERSKSSVLEGSNSSVEREAVNDSQGTKPAPSGAPEGRRDLLFEALARFEGIDYEAGERPTDMEARRVATALARIRKAWPNVTPAELSAVVDAGLARGWSRPTALAIANNLGGLRTEARSRRAGGLSEDTIREVMGG